MTSISVFDAVAPLNDALRELDWLDYMACAMVVCEAARKAYLADEGDVFGELMDRTISAIENLLVNGSRNVDLLEADWERVSTQIRNSPVPGLISFRTSLYVLSGEIAGASAPYSSLERLLLSITNYNLDRPGTAKAARTENDRAIEVDGMECRALEDVRRLIAKVQSAGRLEVVQNRPTVHIG